MTFQVLHVDDEADIREVVEISLSRDRDFVTKSCGSGQEALQVAAEWRPDIIVLDVMMPVMDGPTTLARLRENALTASIPVIFMTARAQSRELDLFRSLGAAGVIPKPFDPMTLPATVRKFLPARETPPVDDQLDVLRDHFLQRAASDAAILSEYRSGLDEASAPVMLGRIGNIAHRLAGAGGIYGFPEISDAAAAVEEAVIQQTAGAASLDDVKAALDRLFVYAAMPGLEHGTPSSLN